jgi:hypothetical protein
VQSSAGQLNIRARFLETWPRLELWGLRASGAWIVILGVLQFVISLGLEAPYLSLAGSVAVLVAGVLTIDSSREVLAVWTVAGAGAFVLAGETTRQRCGHEGRQANTPRRSGVDAVSISDGSLRFPRSVSS